MKFDLIEILHQEAFYKLVLKPHWQRNIKTSCVHGSNGYERKVSLLFKVFEPENRAFFQRLTVTSKKFEFHMMPCLKHMYITLIVNSQKKKSWRGPNQQKHVWIRARAIHLSVHAAGNHDPCQREFSLIHIDRDRNQPESSSFRRGQGEKNSRYDIFQITRHLLSGIFRFVGNCSYGRQFSLISRIAPTVENSRPPNVVRESREM